MSTDNINFVYNSATDVLARLTIILGTKTSHELADALGCSPQTVSGWRSRNKVPYSYCVDVAVRTGVSLDWLLTGLGPVRRLAEVSAEYISNQESDIQQLQETHIAYQRPMTELTEEEKYLLEMFRDLDKDDRRDIQYHLEQKKRFQELESRVDSLRKQEQSDSGD
ncbi:MAG: hypothetical protein CENE_03461 [Candidatus Celerinatantimonas neptuna]|nr:MAG: hypothetical protein CENE_03461 [Candidatus Celerinatantimonas neptuna]